jgi:hypothetical protein
MPHVRATGIEEEEEEEEEEEMPNRFFTLYYRSSYTSSLSYFY